jgi:hypothetical protein
MHLADLFRRWLALPYPLIGAWGLNEQIFGVIGQVRRRDPSD